MTIQYSDISTRTKLLIVLLSLIINTSFIVFILNSRRVQTVSFPARIIKLDEEEIIAPSQFMQPMQSSTSSPVASAMPQQTPTTQAQPDPQPMPQQQQDFEWVSGSAGTGAGTPGAPAQEKKAEDQPQAIQDEQEIESSDQDDSQEEGFEQNNNETAPSVNDETDPFPAGSTLFGEQAIISPQQELRSITPQKTSKPTRQLPSLADLTKNFIDRVSADDQIGTGGGGGIHAIGVNGARAGIVSEKQLTYERYLRKLLMCISTSSKIHKRSIPRTAQKSQARVQFVLNRDGTYYTLGMAQGSGNAAIDDLILTIFKDAASSFPPVPQSLSVPFIAPMFVLNSISDLLVPENWSVSVGQ